MKGQAAPLVASAGRRGFVSVVIASGAGGEFLYRCLGSLKGQLESGMAEVLVVDRTGPDTIARLARECPFVRAIPAPVDHRPTVPELRRIGVENARGHIVAVIEEHCVAPPGWVDAILASFEEGDAAIGGPILDSDFDRLRDWVVYFSEYHNYLPPWPDGERYALNGANVAYDRAKLLKHSAALDEGYWEVVLHPRLAADGRFRAVDAMGVRHTGPFDYGYYLGQRYLLSRGWGGAARGRASGAAWLLHVIAGPLLPLFLFGRVTQRVLASGRNLGRYAAALPLLVPVWLAYAWGEWLGYLVGPGRALELVE